MSWTFSYNKCDIDENIDSAKFISLDTYLAKKKYSGHQEDRDSTYIIGVLYLTHIHMIGSENFYMSRDPAQLILTLVFNRLCAKKEQNSESWISPSSEPAYGKVRIYVGAYELDF